MPVKKFRKKPVVIEALQYLREKNIFEVQDFCGKSLIFDECKNDYRIGTLEGVSYLLQEGDWIIKGVKGEFYPCKPDIFEMTYDKVNEI